MEPVALLYWIRPSIIQKQTTLPHLSVLPGDHQGTHLYREDQLSHLSPKNLLKVLHVSMKFFPLVGILSERMMTMSYLIS